MIPHDPKNPRTFKASGSLLAVDMMTSGVESKVIRDNLSHHPGFGHGTETGVFRERMAESDLTKQFISGVRQDRLLLLTAGALLLCLLPFFLPGLDYEFIWHYNMGLTTLIVMPICIAWLWPRAKERLGPSECVFWRMLAGAFALWLAVKLSQWLLEGDYYVRPIALAQDIGHVGY